MTGSTEHGVPEAPGPRPPRRALSGLRRVMATCQESGTAAEHAGLTVPFPPCPLLRRWARGAEFRPGTRREFPQNSTEPRTRPHARHPSAVA